MCGKQFCLLHRDGTYLLIKKAEENYINFGKFKASLKAQSSLNDLNSVR
jgi:hypothetical protein